MYRAGNKKIHQRIWIFIIRKRSILQMWKKLLDTVTKT